MIFGKSAWGVDIGRTAIKVVKLVWNKGMVQVDCLESFILPHGPDVDEDTRDLAVRDSLAELLKRRKVGLEPVCLSIPGQMMLNRFLSLPPVQEKRIPEIVRYEARQLIPFPLDDIVWDFQLIGSEKGVVEREAALFAVKEEVVRAILRSPLAVDFPVDMMQVGPLAAYNLIKFDRAPQEPVAILDMGASTTDLVIVDGDRFWLRNLSIAGDDITEAFQEKFGMTFEEAEELKRKAGESKQADKILDVMRPVLRDLVGEVQRSMGFYKSQASGVKFSKILLMGSAADQVGLKEFLAENLEYEVEPITSLERIALSPEAGSDLKAFGVALGLALQGLQQATINVNLLPHDVAFRRQLFRKRPFIVAAVACLTIGLLLAYVSTGIQLRGTEELLEENQGFVKNVENLRYQYDAAKNDADPLREEIEKLGGLGGKRLPWADILENVTVCASPKSIWLTLLKSEIRTKAAREKVERKERRENRHRPGGPGGPGEPGGPGGHGGPGRDYSTSSAAAVTVDKVQKMPHFTLEGATEEIEQGAAYILKEIVEPLRHVPEFRNIELVRTAEGEITLEAVRSGAVAEEPDIGPDQPKTEPEAAVLEESRKIINFTIEWDYIPPGPEDDEEKAGEVETEPETDTVIEEGEAEPEAEGPGEVEGLKELPEEEKEEAPEKGPNEKLDEEGPQ